MQSLNEAFAHKVYKHGKLELSDDCNLLMPFL